MDKGYQDAYDLLKYSFKEHAEEITYEYWLIRFVNNQEVSYAEFKKLLEESNKKVEPKTAQETSKEILDDIIDMFENFF